MSIHVGDTIGDYEVVAVLGAGGMGQVYKVRNILSDRVEALKVLLPNLESEPELADRFMREIKVQASLDHPNIAALHTAQRVGNQLLMLIEYVEGITLEEKLRSGRLAVNDALNYISQVLAALSFAHQRGIVHRDIKPANMMLTPQGDIKLMDFGIAKAASDRRLTMTGTTMGSLYYMSPEQIQGATNLDARSDLYSVGVSLYEMVTGKRPFDGDSQFAIMSAHLEKAPVPPIELDPSLPQDLNDAILMSVAKNPNQRFQTADAFRKALGSVGQATRTITAPAAAAAAPAYRQPMGRRGLYIATGAICTALALVAIVQLGPWKKTSASEAVQQVKPVEQQPPATEPAPPVVFQQPAVKTQPVREKRQEVAAPKQVQEQPTVMKPPATTPPPQTGPDPTIGDSVKVAALQDSRERLVQLVSRAGSVNSSLQNLQRSQAASGLGLRGDMVEAASRMQYQLDGSNAAIGAGDVASAKRFLDMAEREIERLEKFLGR